MPGPSCIRPRGWVPAPEWRSEHMGSHRSATPNEPHAVPAHHSPLRSVPGGSFLLADHLVNDGDAQPGVF